MSALLAVTTCFLFFKAEKTTFLAIPSAPPTNSTIISTFLSAHKLRAFFSHKDFGILIFPLFFEKFFDETL